MKRLTWMFLGAVLLSGCGRDQSGRVQGYAEGEFVYVASPREGQLEKLAVKRGKQVKKGDLLYVLESGAERARRDEAERNLRRAQSNLEDAKRGQRPSEIQSLQAQLQQAQAALILSGREYARQERLVRAGAAAQQELDLARSTRDQDHERVEKMLADLKTANLGSREGQIAAAAAAVKAQEAVLAHADWELSQKTQYSPVDGMVFDTLYQRGEWVPAGRPAVSLLPPENVKVRAFVPEARVSALKYGQTVRVFVDGVDEPYTGRVSFISPRAEYTPPVIYSRESRGKLVFLIEVEFDAATAAQLHPGQPLDVVFVAQ